MNLMEKYRAKRNHFDEPGGHKTEAIDYLRLLQTQIAEIKKPLLTADGEQGGKVVNVDLIEATIREIGKEYRPGLIRWIGEEPGRWAKLLDLEGRINRAVLSKDEVMLKDALARYRVFFQEMVGGYGEGETLPLLRGRANG